ncbi:MAG: circadian clock protein KaiC [Thermoanaerobaculia bacterium]
MGKFVLPPSRALTGIPGFDELTSGLPRGRTTLVVGGPGCGKSILALQTLVEGARRWKEPGIFVAFEESAAQIVANAEAFEWDLTTLQRKKLFFLDAHLPCTTLQSGPFDVTGLLAGLSAKAKQMGAKRIVFDGLDVLLSQLDDPVAERREVHRIHEWLATSGFTGILTAKSDGETSTPSRRFGFLQYLADCVVSLNHRLVAGIAVRHLRILKYRGGSASTNELPMIISDRGLEVGYFDETLEYPASTKRISSGVLVLDNMLGGGFFRATCTLISGAPGTAKSTLAGAFADAACRRGEPTLYVSFDESGAQIVRNLRSVRLALGSHIRSGLLVMHSVSARSRSSEEHLLQIRSLIEKHHVRCLVVDPLSALPDATADHEARGSIERLISSSKRSGITILATSLLANANAIGESTAVGISTIADTWIHLSYNVQGGERNRALTIVKSRGMGHSNQVRELVLTRSGVTLTDVYTSGGDVLMGTLRWEKEEQDRAALIPERREAEALRRGLEASIAETTARIEELTRDLGGKATELERLGSERSNDTESKTRRTGRIRGLRRFRASGPEKQPDRPGNAKRA